MNQRALGDRFRIKGSVTVSGFLSAMLLALFCQGVMAQAPAADTGRWFYERAVVFSIDQKQRVIPELRRAVQADPSLTEAHYLLGKLLLEGGSYDAAIAELQIAVKLAPDHLPARLALATVFQKKLFLRDVVAQIEAALPLLDHKPFELEVARIKSILAAKDADAHWKTIAALTGDLLNWIDDLTRETPQQYQKLTTERGLRDAAIYLELASMYAADEDTAPDLLPKFLQAIIHARADFFPVALFQYGALLQQKDPKAALSAYETGVAQLKALGLQEGADFDLSAINELRKSLSPGK